MMQTEDRITQPQGNNFKALVQPTAVCVAHLGVYIDGLYCGKDYLFIDIAAQHIYTFGST